MHFFLLLFSSFSFLIQACEDSLRDDDLLRSVQCFVYIENVVILF